MRKVKFIFWALVTIQFFMSNPIFAILEIEPNDNFNNAQLLSGDFPFEVQGSINPIGDIDIYQVEVDQPGVLEVSINNIASNINLKLYIHNENQDDIATTYNLNGGNVNLVKLICEPGIYYFELRDLNHNNFSPQLYNMVVNFNTDDEYECNNDFQNAAEIGIGEPVQGQIYSLGDIDFYQVEVDQPGVFEVSINNIASNINLKLYIHNENQDDIATTYNLNGGNVNLVKLVCEPGIYYFELRDLNHNNFSPQLYNMVVNFNTDDEYECNNDFQNAAEIGIGEPVQGQIYSLGDIDFYQVEVDQPGVFEVSINNIASNINLKLYIHNENQDDIATTYNLNGGNVNLVKLVCEPGIYYFELRDLNHNNFSPQLYNMVVNFNTDDEYECNNDFQNAAEIEIGEPVQGQIYSLGDIDFYQVEVDQPGVFEVSINNIASNINLKLYIHNENQDDIATTYNLNGGNVNLVKLVCEPGIYYFELRDLNHNNFSPQLYNMVVNFNTDDEYECNNDFQNAPIIELCDTIKAAIYAQGDIDYFKFSATEGESISISLTNVPSNIYSKIKIFDGNQAFLDQENGSVGGPIFYDFTPENTGSYYIAVEDLGDDDANSELYSLLLSDANCQTVNVGSVASIKSNARVLPNPFSDFFIIQTENSLGQDLFYTLYNVAGQIMDSELIDSPEIRINTTHLPEGLYFIKIANQLQSTTLKILKE